MKVVIAGSKGFVGKNLVSLLDKSKYSIVNIDISDGIDLSNITILDDIQEFDVFVHLANLSFVPDSYINPETFYRINFLTTLNALELCRRHKATLIYISSYVYGKPQYLPIDERHPVHPFNPYAHSKYLCEHLCEAYQNDFNLKSIILRPFNIYGNEQKGKLLIPEIFDQLKKGSKTITLKEASPRRDFIHVSDIALAIKKCIDKNDKIGVYNLCSGISYSVKEITEIINANLQINVEFTFSPSDRPNEVNETIGSNKKFSKEFDWSPTISFENGLKEIIQYNNL